MKSSVYDELSSFQAIGSGKPNLAVNTPTMEFLAFRIYGVVWYGGSASSAVVRTQGEFMAFMAAMMLMYQPFKSLARTYAAVQQGDLGRGKVFEIWIRMPMCRNVPALKRQRFTESIEFHDVSFGYGEKLVLKDINLRVCAGEMVALVGISGVGKSTMADLIRAFTMLWHVLWTTSISEISRCERCGSKSVW